MKFVVQRKILLLLGLFSLLLGFTALNQVSAQANSSLSFETRIVDENRVPLSDGFYNFKFLILDSEFGGTTLWQEERNGLQVKEGSISVELGQVIPIPESIFDENDSLFIHLCLDANSVPGDGSGLCATRFEENFQTRFRLNAAPWAIRSLGLAPVAIGDDEIGQIINVIGNEGDIVQFQVDGVEKIAFDVDGGAEFSDGTSTIEISPEENRITLGTLSDIFFGTSSLRSSANSTAGANLIGVFGGGFTTISGNTVGAALNSIDSLMDQTGLWNSGSTNAVFNTGSQAARFTGGPINFGTIVDPGSPSEGDLWYNGSNLYFYNGVTNVDLLTGIGGSLFIDGGSIAYLTNTSDDFAVGATNSLVAPFSVDVDQNTVRVGTGSGNNGIIQFYASDGDIGTWEFTSNDSFYINDARIGVGVLNPDALLDLAAATSVSASLNISNSSGVNPSSPGSGDLWWNGTSLYFYNGSSSVDLLTGASPITSSGGLIRPNTLTDDFAIGSNTLVAPFSVDTSADIIRVGSGVGNSGAIDLYASDGGTGRITYTTSDSFSFTGGDTSFDQVVILNTLGAAGPTDLCINASNQISSCSSSQRYKSNITNLELGLDTVLNLRPVRFTWNDSGAADLGFIAEEVNDTSEILTFRNANGEIEGVKYKQITAVLVNAVQTQQEQIDLLENRLFELEAASGVSVDSSTVLGALMTGGHIEFGSDSAGRAVIGPGQVAIDVDFETMYDELPVVIVTPVNSSEEFILRNDRLDSFTIELVNGPTVDAIEFNWIAIEQYGN